MTAVKTFDLIKIITRQKSALNTDAYKPSMAEAGFPLRQETFEFLFRKGGPYFLPVDVSKYVKALLSDFTDDDYAYLNRHEYVLGPGVRAAYRRKDLVSVNTLPNGSWFLASEPPFTVTGPSALASWLEGWLIQLRFVIQVCTKLVDDYDGAKQALRQVSTNVEKEIIEWCCARVGVKTFVIEVDEEEYFLRCKDRANSLIDILEDPNRIFEAGLRAATCMSSYHLAVNAWIDAGIKRTCGVSAAKALGGIPVGTMGHEHPQRCSTTRPRWLWTAGEADRMAYRIMLERRPNRSSFLLDTTDTEYSGIPAAIDVMLEDPSRNDSVRPDSNLPFYFPLIVNRFRHAGLEPSIILENEGNVENVKALEEIRKELNYPRDKVFYGFGGFAHPGPKYAGLDLHRNGGAPVYKLCWSDGPTMKFANEPGKSSIPGKPVIYRHKTNPNLWSLIAQDGENINDKFFKVTNSDQTNERPPSNAAVRFSRCTLDIIDKCTETRNEFIDLGKNDELVKDIGRRYNEKFNTTK